MNPASPLPSPGFDLTAHTPSEAFRQRARDIHQRYHEELRSAGILAAARAASSRRIPKDVGENKVRETREHVSNILSSPNFARTVFYRSTYDLADGYNLFHFQVWLEATKTSKDDVSYIDYPQDYRPWVVFTTQEALDQFEQWMVFYETRWDGPISESQIPMLPETPRTVTLLPIPERLRDMESRVAFMAWYVTLCEGKMWMDESYVFFENQDDAVAFRMVWT